MAGEIQTDYTTGRTVYAQLRNSAGQIWNGAAFENYLTANIANYDIAMTEQGSASGFYIGDMPAVVLGYYSVDAKERIGGAPAESDPTIGGGNVNWTGTQLAHLAYVDLIYPIVNSNFLAIVSTAGVIVDVAATTTTFKTDLTDVTGAWNDHEIVFTVSPLKGQCRPVLSYNQTNGTIVVSEPFTSAPQNGDAFEIRATHVHPVSEIADGILGRAIAGGADGGRTVSQALAASRNKVAFDVPVAGQFTVYAADDTTPLWTGAYTASAGANPVTVLDPA